MLRPVNYNPEATKELKEWFGNGGDEGDLVRLLYYAADPNVMTIEQLDKFLPNRKIIENCHLYGLTHLSDGTPLWKAIMECDPGLVEYTTKYLLDCFTKEMLEDTTEDEFFLTMSHWCRDYLIYLDTKFAYKLCKLGRVLDLCQYKTNDVARRLVLELHHPVCVGQRWVSVGFGPCDISYWFYIHCRLLVTCGYAFGVSSDLLYVFVHFLYYNNNN